jgi:hypothetical protein
VRVRARVCACVRVCAGACACVWVRARVCGCVWARAHSAVLCSPGGAERASARVSFGIDASRKACSGLTCQWAKRVRNGLLRGHRRNSGNERGAKKGRRHCLACTWTTRP